MKSWQLVGVAVLCLAAAVEPRSVDVGRVRPRSRPVPPSGYRTVQSSASRPSAPAETPAPPPPAETLLKPGFKIVTELPKPKPGFYLNRQFGSDARERKAKALASDGGAAGLPRPKEAFFLNRQFQPDYKPRRPKDQPAKVIEENGRYWKVVGLPEPDESFYLNRQFRNNPATPKKVSSDPVAKKEIFLVKESTERPRVVQTPSPGTVEQGVRIASGQTAPQRPKPSASFYDAFRAPRPSTAPQASRRPSPPQPANPSAVGVAPVSGLRQGGGQRGQPQQTQAVEAPSGTSGSRRRTHLVTAQARPQRDEAPSAGTGFSCHGRPYGYYADVESGCRDYHICNPVSFAGKFVQYYKYSFSCGPGMQWDSQANSCVPAALATPCT
ncbi:translation initiation factor IF-2-like [Penaeus monodon]|uniref:translation initiation factor IF-2-like n=1 Tax=Penaeus monodon TaxID=6687 RepID=UPI0018A7CBE9|nr:translation initiation factor IF-2-like [Penaeus monodon]